mgnify:FL=1
MKKFENDFVEYSDDLQEIIGRNKQWMGIMLVYVLLAFLMLFFIGLSLISYHNQSLLKILSQPMLHYFEMT